MKNYPEIICPFCNSDNVVIKKNTTYATLISILLFNFPFPFFKKVYYCFDCEKEWKIDPKG